MSKIKYSYNNHPEVVYGFVWEDTKGKLLEIISAPNIATVGCRYFVAHADLAKFYTLLPVEKWLVLKEWSDGTYSVTGKDHEQNRDYPFASEKEAIDFVECEIKAILCWPNSEFRDGKYVFKAVKIG